MKPIVCARMHKAAGGGGGPTAYRYWRFLFSANNGAGAPYFIGLAKASLLDAGAVNRADITQSPTTTASSFDSGSSPSNAADNDNNSEWVCQEGALPVWLAFDITAAFSIVSYKLKAQRIVGDSRAPQAWKLQANNSSAGAGETWIDIHTVAGESAWSNLEERTYTI